MASAQNHKPFGGCTMSFTNEELGLLVDAISWELEMFEVWSDSPRHATLRALQERIEETINEAAQ